MAVATSRIADNATVDLLYQFERQTPRHEQDVVAERQLPFEQRMTDELVERIVPADVLAYVEPGSIGCEARRGVQSAGLVEHPLLLREPIGQRTEHARGDRRARTHGNAPHLDLLERGFATDATRRVRQVTAIAQTLGNGDAQAHGHDVEHLLVLGSEAIRDAVEVVGAGEKTFGEAQARGELEVVARRAHRDRERHRLFAGPQRVSPSAPPSPTDRAGAAGPPRRTRALAHRRPGDAPARQTTARERCYERPRLRRSEGVSTSANMFGGPTARHCSSASSSWRPAATRNA